MKRIVRVLAAASAITMAALTSSADVLDNWTLSFEPAPALAGGKDRKDDGRKQEKRDDKKQDEGKKDKKESDNKSDKKQAAKAESRASSKAESKAKAKGGDGKSLNVGNVPIQNNVQLGGPTRGHEKDGKQDHEKGEKDRKQDDGKQSERCGGKCDEHQEQPRQEARNDDQQTSVGNGGDAVARSGDAHAGDATATSTATNTAECCPPEHQPDGKHDAGKRGGKRDGKSANRTEQRAESDADASSEAESEAKAEGGDGKSINVLTVPVQNNAQLGLLGGDQRASNDDQTTEVGNGGDAEAKSGDARSGDATADSTASNTADCCPTEPRPEAESASSCGDCGDGKPAGGTDQHADSDADAKSEAESEAKAEGGDGKSINVLTVPIQNNTQVSLLGGDQYASNDDQQTSVGNGGDAEAKSGDVRSGVASAISDASNSVACCSEPVPAPASI